MLNYKQVQNQTFLQVTQNCNLKCSFCPLWNKRNLNSDNLVSVIQNNSFFQNYPLVDTYNIIGGDPLMFSDLVFILSYLKSKNRKIRLWTNSVFSVDYFEQLTNLVDEYVLYTPSVIPDYYNEFTGAAIFSEFEESLSYLVDEGERVLLNYPIIPENVPDLADIYEYAYDKNLHLIMHYSKYDTYSADSVAFIKRFYKIKNVSLFQETIYNPGVCRAIPMRAFLMHRYHCYNYIREKLPF